MAILPNVESLYIFNSFSAIVIMKVAGLLAFMNT